MIHYVLYEAIGISSLAEFDCIESVEENIEYYRKKDYSHVPLPFDGSYFNVRTGEVKDLSGTQVVDVDFDIRSAVNLLTEYPFLLVDNRGSRGYYYIEDGELDHTILKSEIEEIPQERVFSSPEDVIETHPEHKEKVVSKEQEQGGLRIVTPADLNKRGAKELFYTIIAELETGLAEKVEKEYPESRDLFPELKPNTIGRWEKAGLGEYQMHITEYMNLSEIQKVIAKSEDLRSQCGFESRNQFDKQMSGIIDLRNRVMHTSRTIIHERDDVEQLYDRICRAEEVLSNI